MNRFTAFVIGLALAAAGVFVASVPSYGFGSIDSPTLFSQNAEHQHITESLQAADSRWDNLTLQLIAGNSGNYGGVAAPDRITDSSSIPIKGLGPGYKHCDDGDFLPGVNYSQSQADAQANLNQCIRYYQNLLERAVNYAGMLVTPDLAVDTRVFNMTSGSSVKPDSVCKFRFSMTSDKNTKCDVINGIGRALHLAEDVWSHSNWGDVANPAQPVSISNPPGLGKTTVPSFLRFPSSALAPADLISGCDDSASKSRCTGRIGHSALAKDNGIITATKAVPNDSYPRAQVTVDGVTNFQRAVTGAKLQVATTLSDFEAEVLKRYGAKRGATIMSVLQKDTAQNASLAAAAVAAPESIDMSLATAAISSEFAANPANDAAEGTFNKVTDTDEATTDLAASANRQAAGGAVDIVTGNKADNTGLVVAISIGVLVLLAAAGVWIARRRKQSNAVNK